MTCWNSIVELVSQQPTGSHATPRQDTVVRFRKKDEVVDPLTELLRRGALVAGVNKAVSAQGWRRTVKVF